MRLLVILTVLCVLVAGVVWFRGRQAEDLSDRVTPRLYGTWEADGGRHEGSRLLLRRSRVELSRNGEVTDSGPLLAIRAVPAEGGYQRYRVEYGNAEEPSALIVMLDASGDLRLANQPATAWKIQDSENR